MCVLGRPFGLRQLARLGKNVSLVRDMTDTSALQAFNIHVAILCRCLPASLPRCLVSHLSAA